MVIALVLLSLAMIGGGVYAAFQGWEIVVLERGWSLMIAGSVTAASGALLLGLAAAVARLEAIRKEVAQLRDRMSRAEIPAVLPPPPSLDPMDAVSASFLNGGGTPEADRRTVDEEEPVLPLFMRRAEERDAAVPQPGPSPAVAPEPEARPEDEEQPERGARVYEDERPRLRLPGSLFRFRRDEERLPEAPQGAGPLREPEPEGIPEPSRPSQPEPALAAIAPEPEPEPAPEPVPAGPPPTIVGSYNAGDNRYVMYSDGSIDADTPQGVFRFGSLDELKQFIASGGDRPPTGA